MAGPTPLPLLPTRQPSTENSASPAPIASAPLLGRPSVRGPHVPTSLQREPRGPVVAVGPAREGGAPQASPLLDDHPARWANCAHFTARVEWCSSGDTAGGSPSSQLRRPHLSLTMKSPAPSGTFPPPGLSRLLTASPASTGLSTPALCSPNPPPATALSRRSSVAALHPPTPVPSLRCSRRSPPGPGRGRTQHRCFTLRRGSKLDKRLGSREPQFP